MKQARVFSDGRFYNVNLNPDTTKVLQNCVKDNGAYIVVRKSERAVILRNQA